VGFDTGKCIPKVLDKPLEHLGLLGVDSLPRTFSKSRRLDIRTISNVAQPATSAESEAGRADRSGTLSQTSKAILFGSRAVSCLLPAAIRGPR
jgi:hypothetical protein